MKSAVQTPAAIGSGHAKPSPVRPALCTHIMPSGATCGSPAVKGTKLCFHHSAVKTALGRVTPIDQVSYGVFSPIPFVFAEDAASLEINYQLLLQAVAEKRTDHRTGTLLFRILRAMAENLKNPLIAENPATHGEGDQINPQPEKAGATHREEVWDQNPDSERTSTQIEEQSSSAPAVSSAVKSEPTQAELPRAVDSAPQNSAAPVLTSTPKKTVRPKDDRTLGAAIEALPPTSKQGVAAILAQRDYLHDSELQYFSLPPYDKKKPESWKPDPLHPRVQRALALSCAHRE